MAALARHEKKALIFLVAAFLIGTSVLVYRNIFHEDKIYITKRAPQNSPVSKSAGLNQAGPLNINTASAQELAALPGIGNKLAERIVEYRTRQGSFRQPGQLMDVEGIG